MRKGEEFLPGHCYTDNGSITLPIVGPMVMAECLLASAGKFTQCPQTRQSTLMAQLSQEVPNDLQVLKEMRTSLSKLVTLFSISSQFRHPRLDSQVLSCSPPLIQLTGQATYSKWSVPAYKPVTYPSLHPPAMQLTCSCVSHTLSATIPHLSAGITLLLPGTCLQAPFICSLVSPTCPEAPLICRHYHLIGDVPSFLPTSPTYLLANKYHQLTNFTHCLLASDN